MKSQLEAIFIGLGEAELLKEKENFITALSLFESELSTIDTALKEQMHSCLDNDDFKRLDALRQLRALSASVCSALHDIPNATRYDNPDFPAQAEVAEDITDVTGRRPLGLVISGTNLNVRDQSWQGLFTVLVNFLANLSPARFVEMTQELNYGACGSFIHSPKDKHRPYSKLIHIPDANMWAEYHGSAQSTWTFCQQMLEFFNLQGQYQLRLKADYQRKERNANV